MDADPDITLAANRTWLEIFKLVDYENTGSLSLVSEGASTKGALPHRGVEREHYMLLY